MATTQRDRFFRGFLAALRLDGLEFIETRDDSHHQHFSAVAEALASGDEVPENLKLRLIPSPFTGRYRDFDDALLRFQRGLLGAQNPFYPGINLDLSPHRADNILSEFSESERKKLVELAARYRNRSPAAT